MKYILIYFNSNVIEHNIYRFLFYTDMTSWRAVIANGLLVRSSTRMLRSVTLQIYPSCTTYHSDPKVNVAKFVNIFAFIKIRLLYMLTFIYIRHYCFSEL